MAGILSMEPELLVKGPGKSQNICLKIILVYFDNTVYVLSFELFYQNDNLQAWEQSLVSLPTTRPDLLGKKEQGTQTTGLFYPSSKHLEKKECDLISQKEKHSKIHDHNPLLTAISPGRGYWRKQLDHVCAHLRSYAQNNVEFRTSLNSMIWNKNRYGLFGLSFFQSESRQLLKEVGSEGHGEPFLIEQLIDEGADPNCTNSDDQPALTLAVLNNHHEVIPVLIGKGADINHPSGLHNNTALHEAVLLGMKGWKCIEALLGCNADVTKKNANGLSACDLALKSGSDKIISLFASKLK
uniref:Uncharacterized protein n=1 Tax=Anolis carolinensis TaxID=28377 RepID=A0A803TPH0_ANOCA